MNQIATDLLNRLTKEVKLTVAGARESVLVISERVNRKTQTLRLHWQASTIARQMETAYRSVGKNLCDESTSGGYPGATRMTIEATTRVLEAAATVRGLKKELRQVETSIRDLEVEVLHEELIKVQRDFLSRSAVLSRVIVAAGSSAAGLSLAQVHLPSTTRVAAVLRGPALLSLDPEVSFRVGDIVILVGLQEEATLAASYFTERTGSQSLTNHGEIRRSP